MSRRHIYVAVASEKKLEKETTESYCMKIVFNKSNNNVKKKDEQLLTLSNLEHFTANLKKSGRLCFFFWFSKLFMQICVSFNIK